MGAETESLASLLRGNLSLTDFVWDPESRPDVSYDNFQGSHLVPEIDLRPLFASSSELDKLVSDISQAAKNDGVFQVYNHGVPLSAFVAFQDFERRFFALPLEQKIEISELLGSHRTGNPRYSSGYMCGSALDKPNKWWCESLRLASGSALHTVAKYIGADEKSFSKAHEEVTQGLAKLAEKITLLLFKGLGINEDDADVDNILKKYVFRGQPDTPNINMNHFPACPTPEVTLGLPGHSDVSILNILYQDDVGGLQVQRNGSWVTVKPRRDGLVINLGDIFQVWSNDKYGTCMHRVVLNRTISRYTLAYLYNPKDDMILSPLSKLLENEPCKFRSMLTSKYWEHVFANHSYKGKSRQTDCLRN